jgi:hypothetical protein
MSSVQPMRSKVAIVGTAPSRVEAPYADPSWEIWGMNGLWQEAPRVDRWLEMHEPTREALTTSYGQGYTEFIAGFRGPVYMRQAVEWAPRSEPYPVERTSAEFGEVFACTPAYAIALALLEGFAEIALYGIEMTGRDEYLRQREWVQRLIGEARGRGVVVTLPAGCSLESNGYRYGYEPVPTVPGAVSQAAQRELALATQRRSQAEAEMNQAEGARRAFESVLRVMAPGSKGAEQMAVAVKDATERRDKAVCARLEAEGEMKAAARLERTILHVAGGTAA